MNKKIIRIVLVLLATVLLSFLLAFIVTEVWNKIITDRYNVGEMKFLHTWIVYGILSLFPAAIVIIE